MYIENLIKTKTPVRLRVDMGYVIEAFIIEANTLGIVFHIMHSNHEDYYVGKNIFISASSDCSFMEL
jgi:hypothetical protein